MVTVDSLLKQAIRMETELNQLFVSERDTKTAIRLHHMNAMATTIRAELEKLRADSLKTEGEYAPE